MEGSQPWSHAIGYGHAGCKLACPAPHHHLGALCRTCMLASTASIWHQLAHLWQAAGTALQDERAQVCVHLSCMMCMCQGSTIQGLQLGTPIQCLKVGKRIQCLQMGKWIQCLQLGKWIHCLQLGKDPMLAVGKKDPMLAIWKRSNACN